MVYKFGGSGCFFTNEWHYDFDATYTFRYKIINLKDSLYYTLIMQSDKLVASSNQFITHDGAYLSFRSEAEIDSFLDAISIVRINEYIKKPKVTNLFKD